jgi:hypothetical protein
MEKKVLFLLVTLGSLLLTLSATGRRHDESVSVTGVPTGVVTHTCTNSSNLENKIILIVLRLFQAYR